MNIKNFSQILFIGPQYKNHRGGIGAVLATYAHNIEDFKFIPTYDGRYGVLKNSILFLNSLYKLILILYFNKNIKIVHIHGSIRGSFYRKYIIFLISKYFFRKKVVYHLHGSEFKLFFENSGKYLKKSIYHLASNVNMFICLSVQWQSYLIQKLKINSLVVLNNPIDLPKENIKEKFNSEAIQFLFLGRIGQRKGIYDLLEVISNNINKWDGKIKLVIGGDGEAEKLNKLIYEKGLSNIVSFKGWVNGTQKSEFLEMCDVLVLPSYNEGLPISILEAMSYGKVILSTTVGGIPEVVKIGENGFLFEPGNLQAIEFYINRLIETKEEISKMGLDSKAKVKPFLIDSVLNDLEAIYKKL